MNDGQPRVGISSCLLGNAVRYDGGHKLDRCLSDTLGAHVEWVPVCPELECGLTVPREAMRLVGDPGALPARHVDALQHAAGYFTRVLTDDEKAELREAIDSFRRGLAPLIVPVTLLAHREPWLARQHYLHPHPPELMLRNHA